VAAQWRGAVLSVCVGSAVSEGPYCVGKDRDWNVVQGPCHALQCTLSPLNNPLVLPTIVTTHC